MEAGFRTCLYFLRKLREMMGAYLAFMNILGFLMMGIDKRKAIQKAYRISEKALFLCSILGGSLGSWLGMYVFRHKTRHWYFVVGMPVIFFVHCIGLVLLINKIGII